MGGGGACAGGPAAAGLGAEEVGRGGCGGGGGETCGADGAREHLGEAEVGLGGDGGGVAQDVGGDAAGGATRDGAGSGVLFGVFWGGIISR